MAQVRLTSADPTAAGLRTLAQRRGSRKQSDMRAQVGEFVGNVFYGTLLRQMQASKIKGKYFHGGRGEEVFQAQLGMELAKRMGQAPNDPIANEIYDAFVRRIGVGEYKKTSSSSPAGLREGRA